MERIISILTEMIMLTLFKLIPHIKNKIPNTLILRLWSNSNLLQMRIEELNHLGETTQVIQNFEE